MLNMIKADLYRAFKGKALYICVLVILILATISCYEMSPGRIGVQTGYATENSMQDQETIDKINDTNSLQETREIMKETGSFPVDKAQMGANANLYYFFIVVVVIVLVTDLSNSTVKTHYLQQSRERNITLRNYLLVFYYVPVSFSSIIMVVILSISS